MDHLQNTHKDLDKNDLDEAYFQHNVAYNKFKDLEKRTQSDIDLKNKALKVASNSKYNGY